ncbi:MAG: hypothetical protein H7248_10990 [Microbacteriaceae bacterium]|nr:hypothetical protein [Microbacteriaceae bacterium]
MPRSNRPRNPRVGADGADGEERDLGSSLHGNLSTETKRGARWNVHPVSSRAATKNYLCPGCSLTIAPGVAHVVAWRDDGLMGAADDLASRRHWHPHCWKIG